MRSFSEEGQGWRMLKPFGIDQRNFGNAKDGLMDSHTISQSRPPRELCNSVNSQLCFCHVQDAIEETLY